MGNFLPKYHQYCQQIKPLVEWSIKIVKKIHISRLIIRIADFGTPIAITLTAKLKGIKKICIYMWG